MEAVLSVQHINKHYPRFALEDVSFSLAPNHIMGLIGKNGAGKSTTLKVILNMVSPESGSVTMFHKNFYQQEKECKQKVGVVFWRHRLLSVEETLCDHICYPEILYALG